MLSYKYVQTAFSMSEPQLGPQVEFHTLEPLVLISTYKSLNPTSFTKISFNQKEAECGVVFGVD